MYVAPQSCRIPKIVAEYRECSIFKDFFLWRLCSLNINSDTWLVTIGHRIISFVTRFQREVKCISQLHQNSHRLSYLQLMHFTGNRSIILNHTFIFSHSKWQRQRRNYYKQNIFTDFRALDQADQPVWPGHHPHPQTFPHEQPQHPGSVAPLHQPAPFCWPHPTSENRL